MGDEWYYVDKNGGQNGPCGKGQFSTAFAAGQIDGECLCWNASMSGWVAIKDTAEVASLVRPAPQPAPVRGPAPTPAGRGPAPTPAGRGPAPTPAGRGPAPTPAGRAPAPAAPAKPAAPTHFWRELKTPEGQPYYHNTQTNETTWNKPEELKTEADRERAGEWYWMPHPTEAFVPAKKISENAQKWQFETEDQRQHQVSKKEFPQIERLSWLQLRFLTKDLVMLDVMNHPLIIHNLRERFKTNEIYTNVGTILISLNPYKQLPLYTPQVLNEYINRGAKKLAPHVFEIADAAYAYLREKSFSQSIVISGESGAGKTECTKQCLQYIAEIAGSTQTVGPEERILMSNPILEAFGNAKTLRNNNSSRFGKYVEIFFDSRSNICGASNTNYLLEKSRVVFQTPMERNYHIFYQLCVGADSSQRSKFRLGAPNTFQYLNESGCIEIEGVDDADEFNEVRRAMELLSFTKTEMDDIFSICAGVLHIGNITFSSTGDRASKVNAPKALEDAATLLQVKKEQLEQVCVTRKMQVQGQQPITIGLGADEAKAARDALSKFIYEKLFDWLVERINKSIGNGGAAAMKGKSIGILDIFGFEIFKKNSFEQLCINFTNEKLQQFFNAHTFKLEEKCYQDERIKFDHVHYIDNQPVLDLIENKPLGVLPSIDEELRMPKGSDKTWVEKICETHRSNPHFAPDRGSASCFVIKHYAGAVTYDNAGFLEKNKDQLNDDAYMCLQTSSFKFLASLFPADGSAASTAAGSGLAKKISLGTKFSRQLVDLMTALNSTEPHYIRCVKPNPSKAPLQYEGQMVYEQLQYAGVFEAITIRKQGFPFRLTHMEFFQRYKCLYPNTHKWSGNTVENCKTLIAEMRQDLSCVQIGTTKVLYRAEQHRDMELRRNLAVEEVTVYIQKHMRIKMTQLLMERCKKIRPVYAAAIASRDMDKVDEALAQGASVGFKTLEYHQCERMKFIFQEEKRLDGILSILVTQNPHECFLQLSDAVKSANDIEMQTPNAQQARALLEEAVQYRAQLEGEANEQVQRLEEPNMKSVLERADAVGFSTEALEKIRTLLYDTAEDAFVKLQLKASVMLKDRERITRTTIRLKDLFFEKNGDAFRFIKYGKLYPQAAWADLKFLTMDREQLAIGMLKWTKSPIHNSLTQIPEDDKLTQKLAKEMFKNILGYMGDKHYAAPNLLAAEVLKHGLQHPNTHLRSEIFCQIIKQVSANPNPESTQRGWDLMVLCLHTFPPPSDFENYLEMYLRSFGNPPAMYVNLMHDTLYGGAKPSPPQEHEFPGIIQNARANSQPRGRGNSAVSAASSSAPPQAKASNRGGGYGAARPQGPAPSHGPAAPAPRGPAPPGPGPRGPAPPGPGPRAPAPAPAPTIPEDTTTEWYYICKDGTQKGPVLQAVLKSDWRSGAVDSECIAWNGALSDWVKLQALPDVLKYLQA